jgi:endonuclease/exonuclease/phosphatase family metal-dependent hydrolase
MLATPKWTRLFLFSTAVCLVWGCESGGGNASPTAPAPDAGTASAPYTGPGATLKVMTRNLYFGAEINASLVVPTAAQIPPVVAGLWAAVQQSDFPGRAKLIVDEIVAEQPDIIAFQEMELFRTQSPSDFVPGASPNAETVAPNGDMLAIIEGELAARGLDYGEPVLVDPHTDIELPAVDASGAIYDLRMTDRNVVFVRPSISASNPRGQDFASSFSVPLGGFGSGISIKLTRGFGAVDLVADDVPFTLVNTHLEIGGFLASDQEAQAKNLVDALAPLAGQVILAGDFNSPADGSGTKSYQTVTQAFTDAWPVVNATDPGLTCCTDITAAALSPNERIDLVLYRGKVRPEAASVVGLDASARTAGGLLPSDHMGVVTTLTVGQ